MFEGVECDDAKRIVELMSRTRLAVSKFMSAFGVRRAKAALSSGANPAPAGSNRSSHGGNEVAEAFD
jgi:hypothetical protein